LTETGVMALARGGKGSMEGYASVLMTAVALMLVI